MLNDNQRRRLGVRFSRLVTEAEQLQELLEQPNGPADGLAIELQALIEAVRGTADRFDIPLGADRLPPERQVEFWAALWQTRVLDCRPARLRGSGPVSPELVDSLGPEVDRIAERLASLRSRAISSD